MHVVYVRPSRTKGYIRIGIDSDGERINLTVSESEYKDAGSPMCRDEVDSDSYAILLNANDGYKARLRALRILEYSTNSERSLFRKLRASGYSRELCEEVAGEMKGYGYLDDLRQLRRLVELEVTRNMTGPRKLVPKLVAKGYSASDIRATIDELSDSGVIDFSLAREALIEKRCEGLSEEDTKKILYKNGYTVC